MKKWYCVVLTAVMLVMGSCTAKTPVAGEGTADSETAGSETSGSGGTVIASEPVTADPLFGAGEKRPADQLPDLLAGYMNLVEGYLDEAMFRAADEAEVSALSDRLQGHYQVVGRTDGGNLKYYVAVRRSSAPVYADYKSLDVGYLDDQLYIGYYSKDADPVVLYELDGYTLLDMPLGYDTGLECFCLGVKSADAGEENPAFLNAFTPDGRDLLDFMRGKPELSFYEEGAPYVQFYYQDEDTIKFSSEPYLCSLALTGAEQAEVLRKLSSSRAEAGVETFQEARKFLHKKGPVYSPGLFLLMDGRRYQVSGNIDFPGYLLVSSESGGEFLSLEYNEEIYRFLREKAESTVGTDYGYPDSKWFQTPLKSAAITFPEFTDTPGNSPVELRTQTVDDREKLEVLARLMDRAVSSGDSYGFFACPYTAPLDFVREDGQTLRVFVATDSCDSMAYEGRISFEYGNQADLAAVFDEARSKRK